MGTQRPNTTDGEPLLHGGLLELLGWAESENLYVTEALDQRVRAMAPLWLALLLAMIPATGLILPAVVRGDASVLPLFGLWAVPALGWFATRLKSFRGQPGHMQGRANSGLAFALGLMLSFAIGDLSGSSDGLTGAIVLGGLGVVIVTGLARLHGSMVSFAVGMIMVGPSLAGGWIAWALSIALVICMVRIVLSLARTEMLENRDHFIANHKAMRASRLLDEVEQNSTSWFWETDRHGVISYISPKVARWFKKEKIQLAGTKFAMLVAEQQALTPDSLAGERTLGFYLSTRTPFSDLAVPAAIATEERWWSISGRPIIDHLGHFRGFIGTGTDLTEQRRSEAEVVKLARYDPLTGLANRSEIGSILQKAMQARPGEVRSTGLMLIDLDRFKAVNDLFGHPTGDELLKQVSARLGEVVGSRGQVGRLGGDEFKVVFPGLSDKGQLAAIADALIVSASKPYFINAANISIGASVGIAVAPYDGTTAEELVRNADLALYAAKGAGRGIHRFYESTMHSVAEERHLIESDMREALANGQFRLVYQPIVSLEHERIIGFEALLRWNHPLRGQVSPEEFIPVAEENGMIESIGEWALREAAREAASWAVDARVAVNVSTIQFQNPNFPSLVANVIAQSGIRQDRLELEITESVFVSATEATDEQFVRLKRLGVRLALDDFGTGYSSLGYLKRAPFDKIKIDKSFVRGASLGQSKNAAIIKAIVTLAQTMDLETTAEGVETQDEIEFIKQLGCSHIQGFVFGKPVESQELREWLGTRGDQAQRVGHKATREPRLRIFRQSQLSINGRLHPVRMRNISNGGVMVEGPGWVTAGTPVTIDITDTVTVDGTVAWADDGKIGIAFNQRVVLANLMPQAVKAAYADS